MSFFPKKWSDKAKAFLRYFDPENPTSGGTHLILLEIFLSYMVFIRPFGIVWRTFDVLSITLVYILFGRFLLSFPSIKPVEWRPIAVNLGVTVVSLFSVIFLFACLFRKYGLFDVNGNKTHDLYECLYFSVITITTVGYGDIHPYYGASRLVSSIEALSGYIILGILVASISNILRPKT